VRIATLASVPVAFWLLLAIARGQDGEFGAPRYVAFGALPIALLIVEAVRSQPRTRGFKYAAIVAICFCMLANWNQLLVAGRNFRYIGSVDFPIQTALEMSSDYAPPTFQPSPTLTTYLTSGPYKSVVRSFGSNAPTPAQLTKEPEGNRALADSVLVAAGAITYTAGAQPNTCAAAGGDASESISAGRSLTINVLSGPTVISARRFADVAPTPPLHTITTPSIVVVSTHPDAPHFRSPIPWTFSVSGGSFEICR
jgi:hypothetical protein